MAGTSVLTDIRSMIDLAIGTPEMGVVDFCMLHTVLHCLAQQLNALDKPVELLGGATSVLSAPARDVQTVAITEYIIETEANTPLKPMTIKPPPPAAESTLLVVERVKKDSSQEHSFESPGDRSVASKKIPSGRAGDRSGTSAPAASASAKTSAKTGGHKSPDQSIRHSDVHDQIDEEDGGRDRGESERGRQDGAPDSGRHEGGQGRRRKESVDSDRHDGGQERGRHEGGQESGRHEGGQESGHERGRQEGGHERGRQEGGHERGRHDAAAPRQIPSVERLSLVTLSKFNMLEDTVQDLKNRVYGSMPKNEDILEEVRSTGNLKAITDMWTNLNVSSRLEAAETGLGKLSSLVEDLIREGQRMSGGAPGYAPAGAPGYAPAGAPGYAPAVAPGQAPAGAPGYAPAGAPGPAPAGAPGYAPAGAPGYAPAGAPGQAPAGAPGYAPAGAPGYAPAGAPGQAPAGAPGYAPAGAPGQAPAGAPGYAPAGAPGYAPAGAPGQAPAGAPGQAPAGAPSQAPAGAPGYAPAGAPGQAPAGAPGYAPAGTPGQAPAGAPGYAPAGAPGYAPAGAPGQAPAGTPGYAPGDAPGYAPAGAPGYAPAGAPGYAPAGAPGYAPAYAPVGAQAFFDESQGGCLLSQFGPPYPWEALAAQQYYDRDVILQALQRLREDHDLLSKTFYDAMDTIKKNIDTMKNVELAPPPPPSAPPVIQQLPPIAPTADGRPPAPPTGLPLAAPAAAAEYRLPAPAAPSGYPPLAPAAAYPSPAAAAGQPSPTAAPYSAALSRRSSGVTASLADRLTQLERRVKECCEDKGKHTGIVGDQLGNFQDQLDHLTRQVAALHEDFAVLKLSPNLAKDLEGLMQLYQTVQDMQEQLRQVNDVARQLASEKDDRQHHIKALLEQIEILKTIKMDREDMAEAMAEKADLRLLARKVSHDQFEMACDDLSRGLEHALGKLNTQEALWQQVLDDVQREIESKLDKMELSPLRDFFENKLRQLQDNLKQMASLRRNVEAAGTTRRLLRDVNCISCDANAVMPLENAAVMPSKPLPAHLSMKPYLSYELDTIRKTQQSGLPQRNLRDWETIEKQKAAPKQPVRVRSETDKHICNRYCGGSHTTTTPAQRVARVGHFIKQWGPDVVPLSSGMAAGDDGRFYKVSTAEHANVGPGGAVEQPCTKKPKPSEPAKPPPKPVILTNKECRCLDSSSV